MLNNLKIGRRLAFGFAAVIIVFSSVSAIALYSGSRLSNAQDSNIHTHKVIATGNDMLLAMVNMETGSRGFIIAGADRFLEPWNAGLQGFDTAWNAAKALTADNPSQQERLDAMKARQLEFKSIGGELQQARRDVVDGKKTMHEMTALFTAGRDKAAMDGFRALAAAFDKEESDLLAVRSATFDDVRVLNRDVVIGGSLAATLMAMVVATAIGRSITRPVNEAVRVAQTVAAGNLTSRIVVTGNDEAAQLLQSLKGMNDNLAGLVGTVRRSSESIATGSGEIATGNQDLSQRTEEQASNLQQTAASMEQLTSTVRNNADSARQAAQLADSATAAATVGSEVVTKVVATMDQISQSSKKIGDIISVIDGIAFQTNILALNAAVEAARAGEQGRGFAVVASEVRSLAQRSALAAKEIKTLIGISVESVDAGTRLVGDAGRTMDDIMAQVKRVTDVISEISASTIEQTTGIGQVSHAVSELDKVTQQNAALVEESAAAADSLSQQAGKLVEAVSAFRLA